MNGLLSPMLKAWRMYVAKNVVNGRVLDYGCGDGGLGTKINAETYTGVDIGEEVLAAARRRHPTGVFMRPEEVLPLKGGFDTVVSLATLGLLTDQVAFLKIMRGLLASGGRIVLTTPSPAANRLHKLGGRLGLFGNDFGYDSSSQLPDRKHLDAMARQAGLRVCIYRRFMLGLNQLVVLEAIT